MFQSMYRKILYSSFEICFFFFFLFFLIDLKEKLIILTKHEILSIIHRR